MATLASKMAARKQAQVYGGETLSDGSVRYRITFEKDIHPGGELWSLVVPPNSDEAAYKAAKAARDAEIARLKGYLVRRGLIPAAEPAPAAGPVKE